jgi:lysyl-tRNA synthetase class 2
VKTEAVTLAGRIMALRSMGKNTFADLRDGTDKIQALFKSDSLGEPYAVLKDLDLGDFLGVTGPLFRTRTGEITVEAQSFTVLSKSLRPLPEKWHGLKDVEQRYRQRYLDLIANEEVKPVFIKRSRIIQSIRNFMDWRGYIEVDTPILVPVAAGALARPFVTHHHVLDQELYLRIATELYLKRLIVGGLDKVYEIGRVFRNEGIDQDHNPEFTLLESYEAYADYNDIMSLVENLVSSVARDVLGSTSVQHEGHTIDLDPPWRRLPFCEAVYQHTGIDLDPYVQQNKDLDSLIREARERGLQVQEGPPHRVFDKILSLTVEPHLIQPTFITDHPLVMSPLAKQKPGQPYLVERFEAFAANMEIANSFTELNDPIEQQRRFQMQEEVRRRYADEEADRTDEDYITALEHGMPPTGGLGIGIDRLVMLLTSQPTIRDVVFFPQLRSKG